MTFVHSCVAVPMRPEITAAISLVWNARSDRYSKIRPAQTIKLPEVKMSYVGG